MRAEKLLVRGIVQGVGFRPFVYNLAVRLALVGWAKNGAEGVEIVVQGDNESLRKFEQALKSDKPALAVVDSIEITNIDTTALERFEILFSDDSSSASTFIPPDITVCARCETELKDRSNRRYGYPLTNCAECGPRYTIIEDLPYDRSRTSMKAFKMCSSCEAEYKEPSNRRFHAEPISCPKCGPTLTLKDAKGSVVDSDDIVGLAAQLIKEGKIVAIKGLGGFHLVCDASSEEAVRVLRERKRRPKKPLAVMFGSLETIKNECRMSKNEEELLISKNRPIVLLQKNDSFSLAGSLSFESRFLGCFLPYTPLQLVLFSHLDTPIVATSANISDEPIITDEKELYDRLGGVFDYSLDFDRAVVNACDDSVVRMSDDVTIHLRLARGYAPRSLKTKWRFKEPVLALGAQQKSTVAIGTNDIIVASAHIGDLFSAQSIEAYKRSIHNLQRLYRLEPKAVVCDKNPAYASSVYAKESGLSTFAIQHHKAHFLAGLYEAELLEAPALGVIFDGTGLGDDGQDGKKSIWGGEFLLYDGKNMQRVCHFKESLMLGGEVTAKEPRRSGLSRLFDIYGEEALGLHCPTTKAFKPYELQALYKMWQSRANSLPSSSVGRLFDAVASFAGVSQMSGYEGEAGLLMESFYDPTIKAAYDVLVADDIDFSQVFLDKTNTQTVKVSMFFNTLSYTVGAVASRYGLPVVLSGGVFQNSVLCALVNNELSRRGLKVHFHKALSPNDSSICVGQAVYAQGVQNGIFIW